MILKKNFFLKQDFEKKIAHKNHVLVQFTPYNAQNLRFTCLFKKHDFAEKKFLKSTILKKSFSVKSMVLNENFL